MKGQILWDVVVIGAILGAVYYFSQKEKEKTKPSVRSVTRDREWLDGSPAVDLWLKGEDAKRSASGNVRVINFKR